MPPASLIGQRIGNYIITSLLQEGGMGTVYVAEHPEIGRRVAIKIISPVHGQAAGVGERFLAEARALTRIEHPNIVQIYDFGRTEAGQLYYIMELLKGRELATVMVEHGRMTAAQVLPYLQQICSAMQAAHQNGVIHRDLKPENVFVLDRPQVEIKLLDFGLAKLLGRDGSQKSLSLTATGMVMGTPYTISPEQAAGRPELIGPQTDIYSLGVLLYWLIIGYPPFTAEATPLVLAQHIKEAPRPLRDIDPTVPVEIAALVDRCLQKLPKQRPASALEVYQDFERGVRNELAVAATYAAAPSRGDLGAAARPAASHLPADVTGPSPLPRASRAPSPPSSVHRASPAREGPLADLGGDQRVTTLRSTPAAQVVTAAVRKRPKPKWVFWAAAAGVAGLGGIALALMAMGGGPPRGSKPQPDSAPSSTHRPQPNSVAGAQAPPTERIDASTASPASRVEHRVEGTAQPSAPAPAASRQSPPPADSDSPARRPRTRQVVVTADDLAATCHVHIDGVDVGQQRVPCYLQVTKGQKVVLEVTRAGLQPFHRSWTVSQDEVMSLRASTTDQRIVWPGHRVQDKPDERTTRRKRAATTRRRPRHKSSRRGRRASKGGKRQPKATTPKQGESPEPLGAGTAPF